MKNKFIPLLALMGMGSAYADGLYFDGTDPKDSLPLTWVVGANLAYDDNINPGNGPEEDGVSINPFVGLSFVSVSPQTTVDVYVRLGLIYYFDSPEYVDDVNSSSSAGFNLTHDFNERLRIVSRNSIAYELQPDYAQGVASAQQDGEYFYWQTDTSLGYRWSERFGTYTGFRLTGLTYSDIESSDRFTWEIYNQFRYQLNPQAVLTGDYRYAETNADGDASDSNDNYILGGIEYRFSPTMIGVAKAGVQLHDVDNGENANSPYGELAFNAQVNEQFGVQAFLRYGIENYDTVLNTPDYGLSVYDARETLRIGIAANYSISQMLSVFGGVDYIPSSFEDGRLVNTEEHSATVDESLVNLNVGLALKFNDCLTGSVSYNYTDSNSDVVDREYTRNRISVGLSYQF